MIAKVQRTAWKKRILIASVFKTGEIYICSKAKVRSEVRVRNSVNTQN